MSSYDPKRVEYKLKKQIADLVVQNDGVVFGGYVRDCIIHDHYAHIYYSEAADSNVIRNYNVLSYHPESALRTTIPNDIDCFFESSDDFTNFVSDLQTNHFGVEVKWSRDATRYLRDINVRRGELLHKRLKISAKQIVSLLGSLRSQVPSSIKYDSILLIKRLVESLPPVTSAIYVDALVETDECVRILHPPFNAIDFDCNGLLLSKSGLALCYDLSDGLGAYDAFVRMSSIVKNILIKKTKVNPRSVPMYRYRKMWYKGWLIEGYIVHVCDAEEDDRCIICTERLTNDNCFKLVCCNAKYHMQCLNNASRHHDTGMSYRNECLHCRGIMLDFQKDVDMIAKLANLYESSAPTPSSSSDDAE